MMSTGEKPVYSEWSNPIELVRITSNTFKISHVKLCSHEIVTQFLPIHWSSLTASINTQISLEETT